LIGDGFAVNKSVCRDFAVAVLDVNGSRFFHEQRLSEMGVFGASRTKVRFAFFGPICGVKVKIFDTTHLTPHKGPQITTAKKLAFLMHHARWSDRGFGNI